MGTLVPGYQGTADLDLGPRTEKCFVQVIGPGYQGTADLDLGPRAFFYFILYLLEGALFLEKKILSVIPLYLSFWVHTCEG